MPDKCSMEWSKIKNIVILILLCVNIALLALVVSREGRQAQFEAETWNGAVSALQRSGIAFQAAVSQHMDLQPLTFTREREGERQAAEALLGALSEQEDSSPARTCYAGPSGRAEFAMGGEFSLQLEPGVWQRNGQSYDQASRDALEKLGFSGRLLGEFIQEDQENAQRRVLRYCQLWGSAPVFSCQAELVWEGEQLLSIQGQRMAGTTVPTGGETPLPTADVLVRFLAGLNQAGDMCSRIDAMSAGYLLNSSSRPVQLIPVWLVETDNGAYYVNGLTGEVSPAG